MGLFSLPRPLLLPRRLFELEPEAKVIFGFGANDDVQDLVTGRRFMSHAKYFIQMIDKAFGMLGPDIELLTEILMDLGQKHVRFGVKPGTFFFARFVAFVPISFIDMIDLTATTNKKTHIIVKSYMLFPEYFPSMGRALVYTVEELLGKQEFTRQMKDAWVEVYGALSYDMIRAQKQGKRM